MTIFMFKSKSLRPEEENINYKGTGATAMTCYTYSSLQNLTLPLHFLIDSQLVFFIDKTSDKHCSPNVVVFTGISLVLHCHFIEVSISIITGMSLGQ